jgi:group I intron endonuclease
MDLINSSATTIVPTKENEICGIYAIYHINSGRYYIGSSAKIWQRWKSHKKLLKSNKHHSTHLQNAWNKYGEPTFSFFVVEEVLKEYLIIREQYYLDKYRTYEDDFGFNICPKAESKLGMKHSKEFKEKCRIRMIGNTYSKCKQTEEHIAKRVAKNIGQKRTEETRKKMQESYRKSRIINTTQS